jgi:hypothetical protein
MPQQFPSYRVIIEAYPTPNGDGDQTCNLGFVPSHTYTDGAPVTAVVGRGIYHYGGCWIQVQPAKTLSLRIGAVSTVHGWTPLRPRAAAAHHDTSAYATTDEVPPAYAGSAVELAVDYTAGRCRVAFYTSAAVAGGFVAAPYAKMELRFVATGCAVSADGHRGFTRAVVPRHCCRLGRRDLAVCVAVMRSRSHGIA